MPSPYVSRSLWRRLKRVRPSSDGSLALRPCRVLLREGRWIDRVYLVEEAAYLRHWKISPEQDPARRALQLETIEDVAESPSRLPPRFADRLYRAGESGTGYTYFTLRLSNGRKLPYQTGHAVDFPQWPDDTTPDLVADVTPHQVHEEFRRRTPGPHEGSAPHFWCLYRRPESRWPRVLSAGWMLASWACAVVLAVRSRVALEALGARGLVNDLLPELATPGSAAPGAVIMAAALALQVGLAVAPFVRRRGLGARLATLGLMMPALALLPWVVTPAPAGAWLTLADPRWRPSLDLALCLVAAVNAILLLLPSRGRAAGAAPATEPHGPAAPPSGASAETTASSAAAPGPSPETVARP
jgi:hypothetical protein